MAGAAQTARAEALPIRPLKLLRDGEDRRQPIALKLACTRELPDKPTYGSLSTPTKVRIHGRSIYLPLGRFTLDAGDDSGCYPAGCLSSGCWPDGQPWVGVDELIGYDAFHHYRLTPAESKRGKRLLHTLRRFRVVLQIGRQRVVQFASPSGWVTYCYTHKDWNRTDDIQSYSPDPANHPPTFRLGIDQLEYDQCSLEVDVHGTNPDYWDQDGDPVSVSYQIDGQAVTDGRLVPGAEGAFAHIETPLGIGTHTVTVTMTDARGAYQRYTFIAHTHSIHH